MRMIQALQQKLLQGLYAFPQRRCQCCRQRRHERSFVLQNRQTVRSLSSQKFGLQRTVSARR